MRRFPLILVSLALAGCNRDAAHQQKKNVPVQRLGEQRMDSTARKRLIDRLIPLYDQGYTRIAITLDEFFEGNTDEGSIGGGHSHNPAYPSLKGCRDILSRIRNVPQVEAVFLEVNEVPEGEDERDMWVTVIRALILTDAPLGSIEDRLKPIFPRGVWELDMFVEGAELREAKTPDGPPDRIRGTRIRLPCEIAKACRPVRVVWVDLR
jgi:hypothetical protein